MSPSGLVMTLLVNPVPGPLVKPVVRFAAKRSSLPPVVVSGPLLLLVVLPEAPATASSGAVGSSPAYSRMRMSTHTAGTLNLTVTEFVPAAAAAMFFA